MTKSSTVDFKTLSKNKFEITLPDGVTPSRAARAIFATRGMALDESPHVLKKENAVQQDQPPRAGRRLEQ